MADLNALLRKKAEKRLLKDVDTYLKAIQQHPFYDSFHTSIYVKNEKDSSETLRTFFWPRENADSPRNLQYAAKIIFDAQIEKYCEQEATAFMNKVDSLQTEMDGLRQYESDEY